MYSCDISKTQIKAKQKEKYSIKQQIKHQNQ